MITNTTSQTSTATPTLRDWHKAPSVQAFIKELSEGKAVDEDGVVVSMSKACAEAVFSYIDSKEAFIELVKDYAPEQMLDDGYDVYTVNRNDFFAANRELLLDFAKEEWVKKDSDMVSFLYRSIDFYGLGEITSNDIENAFFNNKIETDGEIDAWNMGCYAINNRALCGLLSAWGVRVGLIEVAPVARKIESSITVTEHNYDSSRLRLISDQLSNDPTLLDTDIVVQDTVLMTIKGSDIEAFTTEFHALTAKYAI